MGLEDLEAAVTEEDLVEGLCRIKVRKSRLQKNSHRRKVHLKSLNLKNLDHKSLDRNNKTKKAQNNHRVKANNNNKVNRVHKNRVDLLVQAALAHRVVQVQVECQNHQQEEYQIVVKMMMTMVHFGDCFLRYIFPNTLTFINYFQYTVRL